MKTIIVVPTYNEGENIERLIKSIFNLRVNNLEVIIVDDASPDGTGEKVKSLIPDYPLYLIARNKKMGLGSAYIAGFKKALALGAEIIFEMDADFSHEPRDIPRLIAAIENGADLAIGSRRVKGGKIVGWSPRRHLTSWIATWFSRAMLGMKTNDVTAGFRAYRRAVIENLNLNAIQSSGYAFQEEMLYRSERAGFNVVEIPVTFLDRKQGKSKLGQKEIYDFFLSMLKLRFGAH